MGSAVIAHLCVKKCSSVIVNITKWREFFKLISLSHAMRPGLKSAIPTSTMYCSWAKTSAPIDSFVG